MGQLLSVGLGQQGVQGDRCLYDNAVTPVVAQEAQSSQKRDTGLSARVPLSDTGSGLLAKATAQRAVGEGVSLVREPGAGERPAGFDEGDVETGP